MVKEKKKSKKKFTKKKIKIDKDENKKKKVPKFQCAECGQAFHQQGIFEDHKSIHTGKGLYMYILVKSSLFSKFTKSKYSS